MAQQYSKVPNNIRTLDTDMISFFDVIFDQKYLKNNIKELNT